MMKLTYLTVLLSLGIMLMNPHLAFGQDVLSPEELLKLKSVSAFQISPKGKEVIYSVSTPRGPNDEPGSSSRKYLRASISNWIPSPLFENLANASLLYLLSLCVCYSCGHSGTYWQMYQL